MALKPVQFVASLRVTDYLAAVPVDGALGAPGSTAGSIFPVSGITV
jgi:hypothetical protein